MAALGQLDWTSDWHIREETYALALQRLVNQQQREPFAAMFGGGGASGHAGWVHVGLGTAERAEIRVQWPDGEWSYPYRVFANQLVVLDRTQPQAEYRYPGR